MTTFLTPRLRLRPFQDCDLPRLVEALANWEVSQWLATPPYPYGEEDGLAWIAAVKADHVAGRPRHFAVAERASDRLVGCASLIGEEPEPDLGYWYHPEAWGQGFATEAGRALLAYAVRDLGLKRLKSRTDPDNLASQRVLAKLGFAKTGTVSIDPPTRRGVPWAVFFSLRLDLGVALDLAADRAAWP